jgi:hypothetical protein
MDIAMLAVNRVSPLDVSARESRPEPPLVDPIIPTSGKRNPLNSLCYLRIRLPDSSSTLAYTPTMICVPRTHSMIEESPEDFLSRAIDHEHHSEEREDPH